MRALQKETFPISTERIQGLTCLGSLEISLRVEAT